MCLICDTLRNDADTGDECVHCGQEFTDRRLSQKWDAQPHVMIKPAEGPNAPAALGRLPPTHPTAPHPRALPAPAGALDARKGPVALSWASGHAIGGRRR